MRAIRRLFAWLLSLVFEFFYEIGEIRGGRRREHIEGHGSMGHRRVNGIFDIWIFLTFRVQVVNYLCQQGVSQNFCGRGGPLSHLVYWKMNPSKILDSDVNTFERRAEMFRYVLEFFYFIQPGSFYII